MKNLIQFLKRFRDLVIFLVLQMIVLNFYFNSKQFHKTQFFNTSNAVSAWMLNQKQGVTKHFNLESINDSLATENAHLRSQLEVNFYPLQNRIYYINDSLYEQQYEYIPANVINSTSKRRNNYITINKGSLQNIQKGMGVISAKGVVGFVMDVSKHYSIVKTILSDKFYLTATLEKNLGLKGPIKWDGKDNEIVQWHGITSDAEVNQGDQIITSGSNGWFPVGIPVGKIKNKIEKVVPSP